MTPAGSGDRVVIEPDDLRRVAARMRGGAEVLSSAGRHLVTRSRPLMPAALESHVGNVVHDANRKLQELALELVRTAAELSSRATQAELGGIDRIAWLVPGMHGLVPLSDHHAGSLDPSGSSFEGRSPRSQQWAETALQDMAGPVEALEEAGPDLRKIAEDLGSTSFPALGEVIPVGVSLDLYVESDAVDEEPYAGATRGALGAVFDELDLGPTGIGLAACLLAGAGGSDSVPTDP